MLKKYVNNIFNHHSEAPVVRVDVYFVFFFLFNVFFNFSPMLPYCSSIFKNDDIMCIHTSRRETETETEVR